ncbi:MAG: 3-ketoacyl-ACP reductase [Bacteroidota bacterium]
MKPMALITGGSRGIGRAIAGRLAKDGYDIAINGVRPEKDRGDVLAELRSHGGRVLYCQGDIGSPDGRQGIVNRIRSEWGGLHLLVNNAGVAPHERLDPLLATEESFDRLIDINLKGPYFLTKEVAGWMLEQKKEGVEAPFGIINIGSISATVVSENRGDYCISKAGFAMHSRVWAVRLAREGIPVYEVRPGVIRTDMTAGVQEKYDRLIADGLTVQPRWGEPEDVAQSVAALASGEFPYSSGEVVMVDGGLTIPRL